MTVPKTLQLGLLVVVFLGAGTVVGAWLIWPPRTSSAAKTSQLRMEATEHDLGVITTGANVLSHPFVLHNDGTEAIALSIAGKSCNCVDVLCPESIPPRSFVAVAVSLHTRNQQGGISAQVSLDTSDPAKPVVDLFLRCRVLPVVVIDPTVLVFRDVDRRHQLKAEMQVLATIDPDSPMRDPELVSTNSLAQVEYLGRESERRSPDGLQRAPFRFRVRIDPGSLPDDDEVHLAELLQVRVPGRPDITPQAVPLEVSFQHHPALIGPTSVNVRFGQTTLHSVRLFSRNGQNFSVKRLRTSPSSLVAEAATKSEADARYHDVAIRLADLSQPARRSVVQGYVDVFCSQYPNVPYRIKVLVLP
jgi:hypothetical protein